MSTITEWELFAPRTEILVISDELRENMIRCARLDAPNETCGILAGVDNHVQHVYPTRNRLASPNAYDIEPADQLGVFQHVEESGIQIQAIYHSHPATSPQPSLVDIKLAVYPVVYVIIGLKDEQPDVRMFWIEDGTVSRVAREP